jgi:hypothetical protein
MFGQLPESLDYPGIAVDQELHSPAGSAVWRLPISKLPGRQFREVDEGRLIDSVANSTDRVFEWAMCPRGINALLDMVDRFLGRCVFVGCGDLVEPAFELMSIPLT